MCSPLSDQIAAFFQKPHSPDCTVLSFVDGELALSSVFAAGELYCCAEPGCHWAGKLLEWPHLFQPPLHKVTFHIIAEQGVHQKALGGAASTEEERYTGIATLENNGRWRWD